MKSPFRALLGAGCAVVVFVMSGCSTGSGSSDASRAEPGDVTAAPISQVTSTPAAGSEIIRITLDGKTVSPSAERREIKLNQPVVFQISSNAAGQLHVHSSPEHVVDFPAGESEITLTFKAPGVIDVEDHALDKLIVQLEVS